MNLPVHFPVLFEITMNNAFFMYGYFLSCLSSFFSFNTKWQFLMHCNDKEVSSSAWCW